MGVQIIAKGSVAPWNSKVIPPVTRGLEGWFTFDTEARRFSFNRAPGKDDARIIGVPEAFATHGRFRGLQNYLETQIGETAAFTLVVLGKSALAIPEGSSATGDDNTPFYVGNYRGAAITPGITGTAYGANIYAIAQNSITGAGARDNEIGGATSSVRTLSGEVATDWGIRAARASDTQVLKVDNLTRGESTVGTDLRRRVLSDSKFRIGSGHYVFGGTVDISAVAIYSEYLSDAELAEVGRSFRTRAQRLGISA